MQSCAICTHTKLLALGLGGERSLRQSLKGFQRWPHGFCLAIAEVNVGLEAVQLDQRPVVDSLKLMRDESIYNADGGTMRHLISYVDNQIMPQSGNSTETNPALEALAKNSPHEVNISELGKLAQDT
jgi:hypothetical protein